MMPQTQHTLNIDGLPMLYNQLKDSKGLYFALVIPLGHKLRCEKLGGINITQFKYFILELPISDVEHL